MALEKRIYPYLSTDPNVKEMADYAPANGDWSNILAITYDGARINGQKTKVFAYLGFPEGVSAEEQVPAVVLVHGGSGHAYAQWVKIWNDRGYAAIAMDTTGYFPSAAGKGKAGSHGEDTAWWQYGLYGPFAEPGYVNAPNTDRMQNVPHQRLEEQWMYHAVVSTILAHNVLRADYRVDSEKIGICGISWGSVIASIAIGYDTRYAYAIPVYGSGYLESSLTYFGELFAPPKVRKLWSAADRFDRVAIPTLLLAWVHDSNFSINASTLSYRAMTHPYTVLCLKQSWKHSHSSGWAPEEIYRFADSICCGKEPLVTCETEPAGRNLSFTIRKSADTLVTARAYYLTEELSYSRKNGQFNPTPDQTLWESVACRVNGTRVAGTLPANAVNYYVELTAITADGTYITTTGLVDARV